MTRYRLFSKKCRIWAMHTDLVFDDLSSDASHSSEAHAHEHGQLTYVGSGTVSIETEYGVWFAPTGRLVWIPARIVHASHSSGATRGWRVLLPHCMTQGLPPRPSVLRASTLLLAVMERLHAPGAQARDVESHLLAVARAELENTRTEDFGLPLPAPERLRAWSLAFSREPRIDTAIEDVAGQLGLSRRTMSRRFTGDLGITFGAWRQAAIVQYAIARLSHGSSVSDVAFDTGYDSPSAFIAMFKSHTGQPPAAFVRTLHAR
jgi:AraC-like DNA-binding protein